MRKITIKVYDDITDSSVERNFLTYQATKVGTDYNQVVEDMLDNLDKANKPL